MKIDLFWSNDELFKVCPELTDRIKRNVMKIIEKFMSLKVKNNEKKKYEKWMKIEGKISEKPDERLILIIICDHKKQTKWG